MALPPPPPPPNKKWNNHSTVLNSDLILNPNSSAKNGQKRSGTKYKAVMLEASYSWVLYYNTTVVVARARMWYTHLFESKHRPTIPSNTHAKLEELNGLSRRKQWVTPSGPGNTKKPCDSPSTGCTSSLLGSRARARACMPRGLRGVQKLGRWMATLEWDVRASHGDLYCTTFNIITTILQ